MSLHTNLAGRLRNTNLLKSHGLFPVFEAVVNSLQALEENNNLLTGGTVTLKILRSQQASSGLDDSERCSEIVGFEIHDNGIGFNEENMASFETLDSDHKIGKGCRGVGRLLWLKAFDRADVTSAFKSNSSGIVKRQFSFTAAQGIQTQDPEPDPNGEGPFSILTLSGFDKKYRDACPKTATSIANALLEHCLWYFVREDSVPRITIKDGTETIALENLFDQYMHSKASKECIDIKGYAFRLTHIKFHASTKKKHSLALCAANRLVQEIPISHQIPGLFGKISDEAGEFIYTCYVSSDYLDDHVRPERTAFDIADDIEGILEDVEVSFKDMQSHVLARSKQYLSNYLSENLKAGRERINEFVSEKAPRYRPVMHLINQQEFSVDPRISDKELDTLLHKQYSDIECQLLAEGHEIMNPAIESDMDLYQKKLKAYLKKAEDFKKSDLASYVSHRRVILDLLEKYIGQMDNGKYVHEELIHQLIMPMRKTSEEVSTDACNLWLIDERLAFHDFLASDKSLRSMPITDDSSTKEPDLCALNINDNPILVSEKKSMPLASLTVVEIKRPMRNDASEGEDKNPIEQALGYLKRIREGKVKTTSGRPIRNSQEIPGYVYVISDLTPTMVERCELASLTETYDGMGFFGYNKPRNAYIEVVSYDRLLQSAKERNRAFFDQLGLPA
ncbi:ATP-binding protein [Endozoicomonas sp. ALD040]|uniref:ATP-binding protein n=1 Tax=Endozoicomonas sp. ALD040 TaxID=3403079 RepID=UPI003BB12420